MDPQEWYSNMPSVTKFLFTGALVTTLAGNFGLVHPAYLILDFAQVWRSFEIWRLVTGIFFFGKLGFPFLINVYFLYSYSLRLENGVFERAKADYVYMIFALWVTLLVAAFFLSLPMAGIPLVIAILYVWCNINAEQIVSFWFGSTFKAMYFPWVLAAFNVLLGGSGVMELIGIVVGHVYFFLKYQYPERSGVSLLETPQFLREFFPDQLGGMSGFGQAPASRSSQPAAAARRAFTGTGQRLGTD